MVIVLLLINIVDLEVEKWEVCKLKFVDFFWELVKFDFVKFFWGLIIDFILVWEVDKWCKLFINDLVDEVIIWVVVEVIFCFMNE